MTEHDAVTITTVVEVEPALAFAIFTEETDLWWRHGPRFRPLSHPQGRMVFEPGVGGRLLEIVEDPEDANAAPFALGVVEVWEPPSRLVFSMGGRAFRPTHGGTTVAIDFEAVADGTRVTVEHRGFAALAVDHPVRHGLGGDAFLDTMGLFWGDLLSAARRLAAERAGTGA